MDRTERQKLVVKNWILQKCKGTACCATGFGKTRVALIAIKTITNTNPNCKITIIVPSKVLHDQWLRILNTNDYNKLSINVVISNTAIKKSFYCDFLIIDEVHRINAITSRKVFTLCNPSFILGLTATYERLDHKEKEVVDYYCPVCDTVSIEECLENNWLSNYKEYKVLLEVDLTEYHRMNKTFMQHFAFFDFDISLAQALLTNIYKQQKFAKERNVTLQEVKANVYNFFRAVKGRKLFIANHPYKLEIAKQIIEARKDKKIITFNSSIKQCESYKMGYVVHSGNTKKKNRMTLEEFSKCDKAVIHSAAQLKEGLDVPGLEVAIVTGFNSSKIEKKQMNGRVIRYEPGKQAEIFTLVLKGTVEEKWFQKSTEDMNYIELNEEELKKVLNNEPLINKSLLKQDKLKTDLLRI
jgi:superfamily II DNA or RNA helicase